MCLRRRRTKFGLRISRESIMEVAIFSSTRYERRYLDEANKSDEHKLHYFDVSLEMDTVGLAAGYGAVCIFVNDKADAQVLGALRKGGTRLLALRCTGFNNVDLEAAARVGDKGRAGRDVFAELRGGARGRTSARDQPQGAPCLQSHPRFELFA
jgi:Lactate dehydrogenase and related dehydrogenases